MKLIQKSLFIAGLAAMAFSQSSCNKVNDLVASMFDKKLTYPKKFGMNDFSGTYKLRVDGLDKKSKILFGGLDYDKINAISDLTSRKGKYPVYIPNSNKLTFNNSQVYNNEFFLLDRVIKESVTVSVQDENGKVIDLPLVAGETLSLVWNSSDGFEGYYKYLVNNNIIDPISEGEEFLYIVFIRNITGEDYPLNEEVVTQKSQMTSTEDVFIKSQTKHFTEKFPKKNMVGVAEKYTYTPNQKYKIKHELVLKELNLEEAVLSKFENAVDNIKVFFK